MTEETYGPRNAFSQELHREKYRAPGETFDDYSVRIARTLADGEEHFRLIRARARDQSFLPAGRQQRSLGQPYQTTATNCFVIGTIPDSTIGIMDAFKEAMLTLRTGGGVGQDFSTLRPRNEPVRGLGSGSFATGPISFMKIWDAGSECIWSAGHRRGAMMAILRVDHPDILEFINAKHGLGILEKFNVSVAVTDAFMGALETDEMYDLKFNDVVHGQARARDVWARIMEVNWDYAEPGVIFIDRINEMNNLWYCEEIAACNPCGEQPLPPYGACLLWSVNLIKYILPRRGVHLASDTSGYEFDWETFGQDIPAYVRAVDNAIERQRYPLIEYEDEQRAKRRMGGGITAMANVGAILGLDYGSPEYLKLQGKILRTMRDEAYRASVQLAEEKGPFPMLKRDEYLKGAFIQTLPDDIRAGIAKHGIRNSHLLSIAPTGTISLAADNVSSGIEPPFALEFERKVIMPDGERLVSVKDAAWERFGIRGKTVAEVAPEEHIAVLCNAQEYVDSAVSKTCNVPGQVGGQGPGTTFAEFKDLYMQAYRGGAKGATTFNTNGKRAGILVEKSEEPEEVEIPFIAKALPDTDMEALRQEVLSPGACNYDPDTGIRDCEG